MNNKLSLIMSILILAGLVSAITPPNAICTKHTLTGDPSDWGLSALKNHANWGDNSTWVPNAGVQFIVKEDYNPRAGPAYETGVHIHGTGSSYSFYDDPQVMYVNPSNASDTYLVWEPYGGMEYNIQALYLDQDSNCIYTTIITAVNPNGQGDAASGDLAINLDQNISTGTWGYEWGVKIENYHAPMTMFGLYYMPDWQQPPYIPLDRPSYFDNGIYEGQVLGNWTTLKDANGNAISDDGFPVYIIQLAIPRSKVQVPDQIDSVGATAPYISINDFHMASYCGNDHLPAPEFPFILVPLAITAIAPLLGYYISRKQN